jgi:ubiquinone/menaquinone biosynthesis C-methylase UbiE
VQFSQTHERQVSKIQALDKSPEARLACLRVQGTVMPLTSKHTEVVKRQFGDQASAYLNSTVHAQGPEFAKLIELVEGTTNPRVLDLGCGAGHVSFHVAPSAAEVVAYDLSADMLRTVEAAVGERKLGNISTMQGRAECLPFAEDSFDVVISRYSAHHWSDLGVALREVRRVLKPGGRMAIVDVASPGQPLLDTYLQAVEVLRDTSHVRDYSPAEWIAHVSGAGLNPTSHERQRLYLEFGSWIARMRTADLMRAAILELQRSVGEEVRQYFEIQADGSFSTDVLVLFAEK